MRSYLILILYALVLSGCYDRRNLTITEELERFCIPPQSFLIENDRSSLIKTSYGNKLFTTPGIFTFKDGSDVTGKIQIEITEVFNKSEMLLNRLTTTSSGQVLESYGMIKITATSDGRELVIRSNELLKINIQNRRNGFNGELFYGVRNDSLLNWNYAGDKPVIKQEATTDSIVEKGYGREENYRMSDADSVAWDQAAIIPSYFEFQINSLGWINCDRFINVVEKSYLTVELSGLKEPMAYLVFRTINSVMPVWFDERGRANLDNLPVDYLVDLIVIDKRRTELMYLKKSFKIGKDLYFKGELRPITKANLKLELKKLDL